MSLKILYHHESFIILSFIKVVEIKLHLMEPNKPAVRTRLIHLLFILRQFKKPFDLKLLHGGVVNVVKLTFFLKILWNSYCELISRQDEKLNYQPW